ncbi:sugar phosphate nucleotidyltransferase [bacterium]
MKNIKSKEAIVLADLYSNSFLDVFRKYPDYMRKFEGKPFLEEVVKYLNNQNVKRIVLCVGANYKKIFNHFKNDYKDTKIVYSVTKRNLGTANALLKALEYAIYDDVLYVDGRNLFKIDLNNLFGFHFEKNSFCTVATKHMKNFSKAYTIRTADNGRIVNIRKQKSVKSGHINTGICLIKRDILKGVEVSQVKKFSFERDYLGKNYKSHPFFACSFKDEFVGVVNSKGVKI